MTQRNASIKSEGSDTRLLDLSASEVKTLMSRFGVRSQRCPELLEQLDLLLALEEDLKRLVPAPHYVEFATEELH